MRQFILVVANKVEDCGSVEHCLERSGYTVRRCLNTADAITLADAIRPSLTLIVLVMLGGKEMDLCWRIRQTPSLARIPVVLLAASASEEDCILGLESGANDYMTAPFSPRELVARIQAVLRRFERPPLHATVQSGSITKIGDIEIDGSAMKISVRGNEVTTTTLEFRLVDYLARNQARVFNRDQLLDAVWGDMQFVTPRTVDACVRRIRRKIEPDCTRPTYLKTIRGVGYRLDAVGPQYWKSGESYNSFSSTASVDRSKLADEFKPDS